MSSSPEYQLYDKTEYFQKLVSGFNAARPISRILLMSMDFEPDEPEINAVMESLEFAAQKGAEIHLGIDARSFMRPAGKYSRSPLHGQTPGPLYFHKELPGKLRQPYQLKRDWLDRLNRYPHVTATVTNKPDRAYRLPVAGRSHIKTAIIDDYIMLGGCNLDDPDYLDMMIGWESGKTSDKLFGLLTEALDEGSIRQSFHDIDQLIQLDERSRILVDAGVPGQSVIFDNALELIDSAQDWLVLTCQFFPNSVTIQHLKAAYERGVKLEIYYSHYRHHGLVGGSGQLVSQLIERTRVPKELFADGLSRTGPKIHAKLIACDAGTMIGSHNYVRAGVKLGTAEIAFRSDDTLLATQVAQKIRTSLKDHS